MLKSNFKQLFNRGQKETLKIHGQLVSLDSVESPKVVYLSLFYSCFWNILLKYLAHSKFWNTSMIQYSYLHILINVTYLTWPIAYVDQPSLMGHSLCSCISIGMIILWHCTQSAISPSFMLRSLRSLVLKSLQPGCRSPLERLPGITKLFTFLG